jgi:hypothetical protein
MFGDTLYPPQPRRGPSTCCRRCRRVARAGGAGEAAAQAAQKPLAGDVLERRRQAPAVLRWRRRQTRRHRQLFSAAGSAPLPAPALKTRFPCAGWTPFCKRRRRRRRASTRGGIPPPPPPQCLCQASTSVAPASPADPATAGAGTFNNNAGGGSQAQSRRRVVGRRRRRRQRGGEGRAPPPPRASARIYTRVRPPPAAYPSPIPIQGIACHRDFLPFATLARAPRRSSATLSLRFFDTFSCARAPPFFTSVPRAIACSRWLAPAPRA